jgi:hypothetical protein
MGAFQSRDRREERPLLPVRLSKAASPLPAQFPPGRVAWMDVRFQEAVERL